MNAEPAAVLSKRRLFVPEVIQTSAMDCGPASLKALLEGFGIQANLGALREACHTTVDGTSIDTLEELAGQLGLEAEQISLPVEHLIAPESGSLPALVVVTLASGLTHFVVLWRVHGSWVQLMDPGRGRRWIRRDELLRDLYVHEQRVPAAAVREWLGSDGFLDPLRMRLAGLGLGGRRQRLIEEASADEGWETLAALDAAVRAVERLRGDRALTPGQTLAAVGKLFEAARVQRAGGPAVLGDELWTVRPAPPPASAADEPPSLLLRGAVAIRVLGRRSEIPAGSAALAAVIRGRQPSPASKLMEMLRADGVWRWAPIGAGMALASMGAAFEALLFRGCLDIQRRLGLFEQRLAGVAALGALVLATLFLEWPLARSLWGVGRRLELRLRTAFFEKIPRIGDRYFQSRLVSDMAERAHLVHWLRILPGHAGLFMRTACELVVTTAALAWLHPPSAPLAIALAAAMIVVPILFQPTLIERDLRMRDHAGGLVRFYLDALLGLVSVRAHAAEDALKREHGDRLREWARAARAGSRTAVTADAVQTAAGFALAAWLLFDYLTSAPGSGWALLLVYWALSLPMLGQELAFVIQQYPRHRNVTLRLLEPLGAHESLVEEKDESATARPAAPPAASRGVALRLDGVTVEVAGRSVLSVDALAIPPGSHVAVVGTSGAGKTSLAGLLLGWYRPTTGRIQADDRPLVGQALVELRRNTVWVEPGVYLWNRSLLENLRFGATNPDAPVSQAVEEAELDEVLSHLPTGLQTSLGEGGALLSGGEGQRVRLGRAIARGDARLVILDEAFRGLERSRRHALLRRARARWHEATFVFVTHDIMEALEFQRVLVIDGGRIVEDGAPPVLAERIDGRFRAMLDAEKRVRQRLSGAGWRRLKIEQGQVEDLTSGPRPKDARP